MGEPVLRIDIENGKYTFIQRADGSTHALRYGEPWMEVEAGSNMVLAMAYELEELRKENARLKVDLARMKANFLPFG